MRTSLRRFSRKFLHRSGLWIEPAQHIRELTCPPYVAIGSRKWIVWSRAERGDEPFLDGDIDAPGNQNSARLRLFRKVFCKICRDCGGLIARQLHHRAEKVLPILFGKA